MKVTIKSLRQAGFKVRVLHARQYEPIVGAFSNNFYGKRLCSKGGHTQIDITTPDEQTTVVGIAKCSLKDSYNRKLGNKIALGRAITEFEEKHPAVKTLLNNL